ncbi:MAG: cation transporter [Proteobacteria bacterium]|nr:cation transporter [Pseudomonadota bacterium]
MGHNHDHSPSPKDLEKAAFRRVLWLVIVINAVMFGVEIFAGIKAGSVSLMADALDFLGDTLSYGLSLFVLNKALKVRASVALLKGISMGLFGLWVLGNVAWYAIHGSVPDAIVMGSIGIAAFVANVVSALVLYRFRTGDSNMRSVWVCSRNDALGNLAVIAAASGVFAFATGLPDLVVGLVMSLLALWGSVQVIRHAWAEIRTGVEQSKGCCDHDHDDHDHKH